ncbi:MAG: hypothetical protein ACYT04_39000 [Nostoc sp.]
MLQGLLNGEPIAVKSFFMKATRERCLRRAAEIGDTWEEIIAEARAELAERPMKSAFLSPEKSKMQDIKKFNVN